MHVHEQLAELDFLVQVASLASATPCSLHSLTHMGMMRQGGNVTKFL